VIQVVVLDIEFEFETEIEVLADLWLEVVVAFEKY
jgi:hypothetical protein